MIEHPAAPHRATDDVRVTRWVATIAGLIGFVLSVATPLLPVVQTTAMLNWPQNGQLNSVTAPLISLTPVDVTATVPCAVVRDLPPDGGVVLGTAPKKGKDASAQRVVRRRQQPARRRHRPQRGDRQRAARPGGVAAVSAHRDHLDSRRHLRHLRRVDRSRRASRRAAVSPTPTCARRSSGCSPI